MLNKEAGLKVNNFCITCKYMQYSKRGDHKCGTKPVTKVDYVKRRTRIVHVLCSKRNKQGDCPYWRAKK
jgi:hypothetical protein